MLCVECVWKSPFLCVQRLFCTRDVDSFINIHYTFKPFRVLCAKWLSDGAHSHVWHESFIRTCEPFRFLCIRSTCFLRACFLLWVPARLDMWLDTFTYGMTIRICGHDSFMCMNTLSVLECIAARHIQKRVMSRTSAMIHMTWLIHTCGMARWHARHDLFTRVNTIRCYNFLWVSATACVRMQRCTVHLDHRRECFIACS